MLRIPIIIMLRLEINHIETFLHHEPDVECAAVFTPSPFFHRADRDTKTLCQCTLTYSCGFCDALNVAVRCIPYIAEPINSILRYFCINIIFPDRGKSHVRDEGISVCIV